MRSTAPGSATAATRRADWNRDAPAGSAAAHGKAAYRGDNCISPNSCLSPLTEP